MYCLFCDILCRFFSVEYYVVGRLLLFTSIDLIFFISIGMLLSAITKNLSFVSEKTHSVRERMKASERFNEHDAIT